MLVHYLRGAFVAPFLRRVVRKDILPQLGRREAAFFFASTAQFGLARLVDDVALGVDPAPLEGAVMPGGSRPVHRAIVVDRHLAGGLRRRCVGRLGAGAALGMGFGRSGKGELA